MSDSHYRALNIANMACRNCSLFVECEERNVACGAWGRLYDLAKAGRISAEDMQLEGERR